MGQGYLIGCSKCYKNKDISFSEVREKENIFNISTGGGMLLFCKDQLKEYYSNENKEYKNFRISDKLVDKEIKNNLSMGYDFTEYLGNLPYYCNTCKIFITYFYFQMRKEQILYIPNYYCNKCKNNLEPVCPTWEKNGGGSWAETLCNIEFKLNMYIDNRKNIVIKSEKETKILLCNICDNQVFTLLEEYLYD